MRIGVFEPSPGVQRVDAHQHLAHRAVGGAFLALVIHDAQTGKQPHMLAECAVRPHIVSDRQTNLHAQVIVVRAVAGRDVHKAGA